MKSLLRKWRDIYDRQRANTGLGGYKEMTDLSHRRLPDWEMYDQIVLTVVPRYKTSELSGDEWRQSILIAFGFKGKVIKHYSCRDMETAIMLLGHFYFDGDSGLTKEQLGLDDECCDQPGCPNKATARFLLNRLTADDGDWLDMKEQYGNFYRKFCLEHIRRGDCGREDADDNYVPLDDKTPEDSTNTKESPSQFGGVIEIKEFDNN